MAIVSGGELVLADTIPTAMSTQFHAPSGLRLVSEYSSYASIYRRQLMVYSLVAKLARAQARLPLKVYERGSDDRPEVRDHPYAELLRNPNPRHDPKFFWLWTASTREVYGEAAWLKVRDRNGVPRQLWPLHPSNFTVANEKGEPEYRVYLRGLIAGEPDYVVPAKDVVHFRSYNPDTTLRGMSFLEPLRQTLLSEDAERRAQTSFWTNGARPSTWLSHPGKLGQDIADRLRQQWDSIHGGAGNFGKTAVLEEGMEPHFEQMSMVDSAYIESRKLNREECCIAADVPPPVVHILDRATFSNITEQMRSMYRDTMAPRLGLDESVLDHQLRPDFGSDVYAEFLLDEVLRGSFEVRVQAWATAIQTGQATPAEARRAENRPFIEGSDRLLINAAVVPVDANEDKVSAEDVNALGTLIRAGFEPEGSLEALGLPPIPHTGLPPVTLQGDGGPSFNARQAALVTARAAGRQSLEDVDAGALVAGLNGEAEAVLALLETSKAHGEDIAGFCARLWAAAKETA